METMIISNPEEFKEKKEKIIREDTNRFHVIADFDRTLTETLPIISILRNYDYLDEDYSRDAKSLAKHYGGIERNLSISDKEKKEAMQEWWTKHFDLLIKKKLNKEHLERVVNEGNIGFRKGVLEFFGFLHHKNIPLIKK